MSQTNIDNLFQITAPSVWRETSSVGRQGGVRPFDDQLARAATARDTSEGDPSPIHTHYTRETGVAASDSGDYQDDERTLSSDDTPEETHRMDNSTPCAADCEQASNEGSDAPTDKANGKAVTTESDFEANAEAETADTPVDEEAVNEGESDELESTEAITIAATIVQPINELVIATAESAPVDTIDAPSIVVSAAESTDARQVAAQDRDWKFVLESTANIAEPTAATELEVSAIEEAGNTANEAESAKAEKMSDKKASRPTRSDKSTVAESPPTDEIAAQTRRGLKTSTAAVSQTEVSAKRSASSDESRSNQKSRRSTSAASNPGDLQAVTSKPVVAAAKTLTIQPGNEVTNTEAADESSVKPVKPVGANGDTAVNATSRLQRGGVATRRGARAGGTNDVPRVDSARFVGRVAKAFQTAHERGGTLQLRLSPPELGSVRLELTVKDGVMMAAVETETASARRVLLDHLPALRERLAEQNIRVERFDVDVRSDEGGGRPDWQSSQQQSRDGQSDQPPPRRNPPVRHAASSNERTIGMPTNVRGTDHGINFVA